MDTQFAPTDKVLFIDFDHTCYDTDMFLLTEIRQPMLSRFDIPTDKWKNLMKMQYMQAIREQHLIELKIIDPHPAQRKT